MADSKSSANMKMQARAKARIPGMTQLLSKRPDMFSLGVWPAYYQKAKGSSVWDLDGNEYLDFSICGIGATVLGFADPDVDGAVRGAIENGQASSLNSPEEVELAEVLCEIHPWADMVRYTRSGGEAMAVAVRIARAASGKDKVAICGYHGWHDWYLAANLPGSDVLSDHLLPGLDTAGVPRALAGTTLAFNHNDTSGFTQLIEEYGDEIGVVVMEVWRNDRPSADFLDTIRKITASRGIVLIFDEITSAFRLNPGGVHMVCSSVRPDIAVFSKALGNGYPIAAIIGRREVMEAAQGTFISSTTWTERLGSTAALALIEKYQREKVHEHIGAIGKRLVAGWENIAKLHGLEIHIGGIGPCSHFSIACEEFGAAKALFVQLMLDRGFLASNLCYCMFAHTDEQVDRYLSAADDSLKIVAEGLAKNDVGRRLRGKPAAPTFGRLT